VPAALLLCLVWPGAADGATGTTADDYNARAHHAKTAHERLDLLNRALAINPNHVPALVHRAQVHRALRDDDAAYADIARAADLAPGDPALNIRSAVQALGLKKYDRAVRFAARAVDAAPADLAYRRQYIAALLKVLDIDEAVRQADVVVERAPRSADSYSVRAEAYEWAGRYEDAASDLTRLIRMMPDGPSGYARRGSVYRALGDGKRALADARAALQRGRNLAGAYAAIGCSYEVLGQLDRALDAYTKAAANRDDKEYPMIWSCIVLRKLGRRAEADKLIKGFRKTFDQEDWIAPVVRYLAGEMTEKEVYELAKDDDPETRRQQLCEATYYIGACHLADKKLDEAEALMKKCLEQRVVNFYEHGFAIRDLRTIKTLRADAAKETSQK